MTIRVLENSGAVRVFQTLVDRRQMKRFLEADGQLAFGKVNQEL